ncbi:MAG: hemerythrin domain-containing protein [Burkholderiaceae bacterium]|nr:hemerythrin domain-containing protein [Burkholderiaceae bacterium]
MTNLLQTWHDEHATFSRLLSVLEQQVNGFHAGEDPSYELMLDIVEYLRHYADQFHHPREDAAFARLLRRSPELRPQINRLVQEHRVIATAGEDLLSRLREIIVGAVQPKAAVETAAATYLIYYRHHIATEERDLLPRAQALLQADDWAAVDSAVPGGSDPLHTARYAALRREIASLG